MATTSSWGKFTWNSSCTAAASKEVCGAMASRTKFYFRNLGDVPMVLNFGAAATAANILTVSAGAGIELKNNDLYDIRQTINVFCAETDSFEAGSEE